MTPRITKAMGEGTGPQRGVTPTLSRTIPKGAINCPKRYLLRRRIDGPLSLIGDTGCQKDAHSPGSLGSPGNKDQERATNVHPPQHITSISADMVPHSRPRGRLETEKGSHKGTKNTHNRTPY